MEKYNIKELFEEYPQEDICIQEPEYGGLWYKSHITYGKYAIFVDPTRYMEDYLVLFKGMAIEHYDVEENENRIIFLHYGVCMKPETMKYFRTRFPQKKMTLYNVEPLNSSPEIFFKEYNFPLSKIFDRLRLFDEIWDYLIENLNAYQDYGFNIPIIFKPIRYTTYSELFYNKVHSKYAHPYYFGHIGRLSKERYEYIEKIQDSLSSILEEGRACNYIHSFGLNPIEATDTLNMCKCVLNLHQTHYKKTQEPIRISDMLSLGYPVISDKSSVNYFGDLITEIDVNDSATYDVFFKEDSFKYCRDEWKKMTYKNEDYDEYIKQIINDYGQYV